MPPSIYGDPKISHDEQSGNVILECTVTNSDPTKTKWFLGDNEISAAEKYRFSTEDQEGGRKKFICEIKLSTSMYSQNLGLFLKHFMLLSLLLLSSRAFLKCFRFRLVST